MPITTTSAPRQLSDGNTNGTLLGQSPTDLIGFYGDTNPVAQPSQAMQAAIPNLAMFPVTAGTASGYGNAAGALTQYTSTQSPSSVATITTAEYTATVTGILATDLVIINKPASQAGLALLKGRASAANAIRVTFANVTAGTLTPTGSEAYLVTTLPATLQVSAVLTPAAVSLNTVVEQSFTVPGLDVGMAVEVNKPTNQAGLGITSARVSAKNTLAVSFINTTAGTLTPTAGETYLVSAFNGLVAASQLINYTVPSTNITSVAANTTAEQSITEAGIAATDTVIAIQKPALQAGLAITGGRAAATAVKVNLANFTGGTLTPTTSETYNVATFRPSPEAPLSLYTTATLTPGSVAANTTAEQTFTVTGLVSGQPVIASPNYNISAPLGIGVAGVRISATNTLAVTFVNTTAAAITPAAGVWTVGMFNHTTCTAGNSAQMLVGPLQNTGAALTNSLRAAMVTTGFIAGS